MDYAKGTEDHPYHLEVADLEVMAIPKRFYMASIGGIKINTEDGKSMADLLTDYAHSVVTGVAPGTGLVLSGPVSSGKTYAACAVLKRLKAYISGFRGFFVDCSEIDEDFLKSGFMGEETKISERIKDVDVLILDDVGSEKKFEGEKVFDIVKFRSNNLKRTIVTSNLEGTGFVKHYGALGEKFMEILKESSLFIAFPRVNLRDNEMKKIEKAIGK